jgi:hypothetical protein
MRLMPTSNLQERDTYEPTKSKTFHLVQNTISRGKERKAHPTSDVDASNDANDGHNNLNCYKL